MIRSTALFTLLFTLLSCPGANAGDGPDGGASYRWDDVGDRVWVGADFWANRLPDWCVRDGCLTTTLAATRKCRTVHLLSQSAGADGGLELRVRVHRAQDGDENGALSSVGFLLGVGDPGRDYRAAALVHSSSGPGAGLFLGVDAQGGLFRRDRELAGDGATLEVASPASPSPWWDGSPLDLSVLVSPAVAGRCTVRLSAVPADGGETLGVVETVEDATSIHGGISLVIHPAGQAAARFAISELFVGGDGAISHPERRFGPILCAQYTLSRGVLKMTAQLAPVGEKDPQAARLLIRGEEEWEVVCEAPVVTPGWTATFRVEAWPDDADVEYRVEFADGDWSGTVRRDPEDQETIVLAGFTGNHNNARGVEGRSYDWTRNLWFPHEDLCWRVAVHEPDLLFFSGDQIYEGQSPTFPDRKNIELDYLYKWFLWCWAYGDLARDCPCICIPDDHDVYQGNVWGEGGRKTNKDDKGGYVHPAAFVKMVERTQTGHLPDPYDPTPVEQGIGVYYTSLLVGGVDFAVLEDRKFKSGCNGRVPPSGSRRADHIVDPDFDVLLADVEGAELLGRRQLDFLEDWVGDWRGAQMKVALSQTGFANAATHHGRNLGYLRADLDSNGWPQSGRRRALEVLRKGCVFHVGGDQHLATMIHHGIDEYRDAIWSFVVPSIANFYPRAWSPMNRGEYVIPSPEEFTGDHLDGLGNRLTVYAATNPGRPMGHEPAELHDGMPGYGIVRFHKPDRRITMECWPRSADPRDEGAVMYEGWPRSVLQGDNDGRAAKGWLPEVVVRGLNQPVIKIFDEHDDHLVTALRAASSSYRPRVFTAGRYRIWVGDPDLGRSFVWSGVEVVDEADPATLEVDFTRDRPSPGRK